MYTINILSYCVYIEQEIWVQLFLSIKEDGHQRKHVTPCIYAMVYIVPNII